VATLLRRARVDYGEGVAALIDRELSWVVDHGVDRDSAELAIRAGEQLAAREAEISWPPSRVVDPVDVPDFFFAIPSGLDLAARVAGLEEARHLGRLLSLRRSAMTSSRRA